MSDEKESNLNTDPKKANETLSIHEIQEEHKLEITSRRRDTYNSYKYSSELEKTV